MSNLQKNKKLESAFLIYALLYFPFSIEFCYSLGKFHSVVAALSHSVWSLLPIIPIAVISTLTVINIKQKK